MKKDVHNPIPQSYYLNEDVVFLAKDLLGKILCVTSSGYETRGIISETEAYNGVVDKASHAYGGRFTKRTQTMYESGGIAYVYLCYGIHHLFNVVVGPKENPLAVLIRGVIPYSGLDVMMERRKISNLKKLSAGPGTMSKAMGITTDMDGLSLNGPKVWIEHADWNTEMQVDTTPRIGIDYAEEDAKLPYRFLLKNGTDLSMGE